MITNRVLSTKGLVLMVHVTLVKLNVMEKLDRMDIIIQLKVKNHQNSFQVTSTTVLHWLLFQMLQKMLRPEEQRTILNCPLETSYKRKKGLCNSCFI